MLTQFIRILPNFKYLIRISRYSYWRINKQKRISHIQENGYYSEDTLPKSYLKSALASNKGFLFSELVHATFFHFNYGARPN